MSVLANAILSLIQEHNQTNAALGWWWADPVAALALAWFVVSEAREAWRGKDACADDGGHD